MNNDINHHTRSSTLSSAGDIISGEGIIDNMEDFEGLEGTTIRHSEDEYRPVRGNLVSFQPQSNRSLISAPAAPPHAHKRTSLLNRDDNDGHYRPTLRDMSAFGTLSKRHAHRSIRREKIGMILQRTGCRSGRHHAQSSLSLSWFDGASAASESTRLIKGGGGSSPELPEEPDDGLAKPEDRPWEALREMFLDNKINVLFGFLPFAYLSHAAGWPDSSVFILNFLAMVPLASMLGTFTEELAAHTNDVIGGLINATFGNAVELVVAVQALLHNDFLVVQSSLIGSVFSNLLLVLGMCFFCGGMCYPEQNFVSQGAVAFIAMLGVSGLTLLLPEFFGDNDEEDLTISRISAVLLVLLYLQLMYFQLSSHSYLFEGEDDTVALIPLSWALIGMVVVTAMVTILSDWLVGSIDGFCIQFNLSHSFVGLIIIPVVGNAVEHISAVSVAMKNKMDLALGIALGSSAQIAVFVLPVVVLIGWCTGRDMSLRFPSMQVFLYLLSTFIVSLVLSNSKSNWLEGSLLIFTYTLVAVGVYFEKDDASR